ncbi:hypothetical protein XYCOK13_03000 [Xylanibacillus composti]|uniref:Uncharacterized protein n=1 Tax=Xylanibacillus composti TaxID=1572762 RepID=A0A8J4M1F5_9BACL|nr:hypothetical protein XYCOK13_03000 [Xylanibacillus composti]
MAEEKVQPSRAGAQPTTNKYSEELNNHATSKVTAKFSRNQGKSEFATTRNFRSLA